jgi:primosomal protein N' (replication factor Y)
MPPACPQCGEVDALIPCGPGIERIFEEVKKLFPEARAACLSRDIPADIDERTKILTQMKEGKLDILIGTQIIAKGLHFPRLTLAGVIDADLGLANADLRATERCFQLLQQVAGRTGREGLKGQAFLQTYMPDHGVMRALAAGDEATFLKEEKNARKEGGYPPFGRLAALILSSENRAGLEAYAALMKQAAPKQEGIRLLGPAPALIFRRAKRYRIRFLVKSGRMLQPYLRDWLSKAPALPSHLRRQIDIDPHSFL